MAFAYINWIYDFLVWCCDADVPAAAAAAAHSIFMFSVLFDRQKLMHNPAVWNKKKTPML